MARPAAINHVRKVFLGSLDSSESLFFAVYERDATGTLVWKYRTGLHKKQADKVVELAFLGMVAAWEDFLEQVFIRYLIGATYSNGGTPTLRLGKAKSMEHAYQVASLKYKYDPERDYFKTTDPKALGDLAKIFFDGGRPFTSISNTDRLKDASIIRNRIAHSSEKCRAEFKTCALRMLNRQALFQGFRASDLLRANAVTGFGQAFRNQSFFEAYVSYFKTQAKIVAP